MILDSGNKQYKVIRDVFYGEKNDVIVCQEMNPSMTSYKTVWRLKDRKIARFLLQEFEKEESNSVYEECFAIGESMYFSFPYYPERPLLKFYEGTVAAKQCTPEKIWMEVVVRCMSGGIPDALMYLIFKQEQLQLAADGSVYFNFFLDLSKLDIFIQTKNCVMECAGLIYALIQDTPEKITLGAQLLERRLKRAEYTGYLKLYKDIKLITEKKGKQSFSARAKEFSVSKKDLIYKILFVVTSILLVIVAAMFLSQIVFGDILFFRMFTNSLKQIGTESLMQ